MLIYLSYEIVRYTAWYTADGSIKVHRNVSQFVPYNMTSHPVPASLAVNRLYFIRNNTAYLNLHLTF